MKFIGEATRIAISDVTRGATRGATRVATSNVTEAATRDSYEIH